MDVVVVHLHVVAGGHHPDVTQTDLAVLDFTGLRRGATADHDADTVGQVAHGGVAAGAGDEEAVDRDLRVAGEHSTAACLMGFVELRQRLTCVTVVGKGLDLAIVEPRIIGINTAEYGTEKDLERLSKSNKSILLRDFSDKKSNLESVVFGYPKNGELKITNGSVLNIEMYKNNRFIDTLAPVDHGNSGGLAIDSEGYTLGIPTNKAGDIGMILDLEYIVDDLNIKIL